MTREEAKTHLLRYRPGTTDFMEPELAEALAVANQDAELALWLEKNLAQQEKIRAHLRQIPVPAGLKEQILSERPDVVPQRSLRRTFSLSAAMVVLIFIGLLAADFLWRSPTDDGFDNFRRRMVSTALRGYGMDFESKDLEKIHRFLVEKKVVENYELPEGMRKTAVIGCAIEHWQRANVAMICFRTGKPLSPGESSDLWLFVVDRSAIKNAPAADSPLFAKVNKLFTATWTRGDKLYLLGTISDEETLRGWL